MASVEPTSYPGGAPGFAVRLERSERAQIVRRLLRWTIPVGLLFAGLVLVFSVLNDRPNIFGLLAVICIGLSGLTLLMPVLYALNERMTAYYVDSRWMAEYRGRLRQDVVDLATLDSISREALFNVCLKGGGHSLLLPMAAIRPTEVSQLLGAAVLQAAQRRTVEVDESIRLLLEAMPLPLLPTDDDAATRRGPPPRRGWDSVRPARRRRPDSAYPDAP